MRRSLAAICAGVCLAMGAGLAVHARDIPATWDHLVRVNSKQLRAVYLAPGADFRAYTKVMLDPSEAAFRKNWLRDYNRTATRGVSRRLTDRDVEEMIKQAATGLQNAFTKALTDGGYQIVTAPGPDVLRVRTAVIDLHVNSPDMAMRTAGRSRSYAPQAGSGTLVIEARDSESGAILGRAVDGRIAGDMGGLMLPRSSVSNRADFERMFSGWARAAVNGLNTLRTSPPAAGGADSDK